MMPSSGTAALMARQARQTRLSGLSASEPGLVAPRRVGIGKERDRRDAELGRALGASHRLVDRSGARRRASTATGSRTPCAVDEEDRPDQIVDGQRVSRTSRRDQSVRRLRRMPAAAE